MGFWFGRKSAPERQKLVPAWLSGEASEGGFARGYQAQLDEVYRRNPVGLRAVRLVAGLVGSLPLFAEEGDAKAVGLVRAHGLMERAAAGLLLHGNAYVRLVVDGHVAGKVFCLIDRSALRPIELQSSAVGASLRATSHGIGDVAPLPITQRLVSGDAMRPSSPCHLRLWREGSTVRAEWVRRSHRGWAWVDGVGDPDDGFPELYRLGLSGPGGATQFETTGRSVSWALAELPAGADQKIDLSVATVGPLAISRLATTSLIL